MTVSLVFVLGSWHIAPKTFGISGAIESIVCSNEVTVCLLFFSETQFIYMYKNTYTNIYIYVTKIRLHKTIFTLSESHISFKKFFIGV